MSTRRSFLQHSALLSAGFLIQPSCAWGSKRKVGLQLYTLREIINQDVKLVIKQVADAGYDEVEMYGLTADYKFFGLTVEQFAHLLKTHNLSSPGGHYTPEEFLFKNGNGDDVKKLCDVGHTLGNHFIIIPWLREENRKNIEQYKILAERLNKAGEIVKKSGLQLAYHNHDFEFEDMNGEYGYEILLNNTDKDLLKMELDLYWVVRGGYDPVALFKQQPGRFQLWHVKDMSKSDRGQNTEIGNGSINFKNIFDHASLSGVKHFMIEQENNYLPDHIGSITKSNIAVKKLLKK